ncbi:hypothetical protein ACHAW5_003487 [Stephanodiscus triporus]|uniref:Uncharacterized protein n=1 Tax=Stephanodiscus triporus TaxID=2934178 RepID=A0ABD3P166_9STRA
MTSSAMLADMTNFLPFLLGMIHAREWTAFERFALSNPETFKCISDLISECAELNGMTLLHACVRYDPPVSVLLKMIELCPESLRRKDCIGRTPLHVAAGSGASLSVLKILTTMYPNACSIQDEDGRTPLHFACDTDCELFEEDEESSPREPPSLDTVYILLAGSLHAVTLEDDDDMNAVEYALLANAPIEVVTVLQKAMQEVIHIKRSKDNVSAQCSPRPCPSTAIMSRIAST